MRARLMLAACLALTAACGGYSPPGSLSLKELPRPDVCGGLPEDAVVKALGSASSGCVTEARTETYGARFSGVVKKKATALIVSYQRRYTADTGLDLWDVYGVIEGHKAFLIGVGEAALFDPDTATMLAVSKNLLVTVGVQSSEAVPQEGLADRLLPVLEAALELGRQAAATPSPRSGDSSDRPFP